MIYGIGIDIVKIQRITDLKERFGDRFLNRVFTESEQKSAGLLVNPGVRLAGRFAVKEAFYKAIGGYTGFSFKDIETSSSQSGSPKIILRNKAKKITEELGITNIFITISHDTDYAIAQVLLEAATAPRPI